MGMNPLYRIWWRTLMDLRPVIRYLAERFPRFAPFAVRSRTVAHVAVGNVVQVFFGLYCLAVWALADSFAWGLMASSTAAVATELVFQFGRARETNRMLVWLIGWREAWRVRRRWPADWSIVAAKTNRVQAEVGTSKEPIASARLRPVVDHPKMSWWPRIDWPVVSWWVGPPPGRSFTALEEVIDQLAANISHCEDMAVEFDRHSDSHGRLIATFADLLTVTVDPELPPADPGIEFQAATADEQPALTLVPLNRAETEAY